MAYQFLQITADTPDIDVMNLGLGLIREASALAEPHRQVALRAYDYLLWHFRNSSVQTSLLLERARLLSRWGQTADALAGYQAIVQEIDAGQHGTNGIKLFEVFWEKSKPSGS